MDNKFQVNTHKIRELLELMQKSPEIRNLQLQCQEIGNGKRKQISNKVIDDAFDATGIIVKSLSDSSDEGIELQKFCVKYLFSEILRTRNVEITD